SRFSPYMSNAELNKGGVILTRYELQEEAGKIINIPFIGRLKGSGVAGAQVLDGAEEELTNYNCAISVDWRRNGVRVPKSPRFRTGDGREYFVAFHGARTFRDLKGDTTMVNANTQARAREGGGMDDNPIFQDGDLIYDGVIHREVPEIDDYCTASGFDGIGTSS